MNKDFSIEQFLDLTGYEEILKENNGKKFDIVLMNPPYAGSTHLKFLEKVIKITDNVVSIQPCRWLQDPLVQYKKSTNYKKYEESISKHIKELEIFDANESTKYFGANFTMKVAIYNIDNGKYDIYKNYKYNKDGLDYSFIKSIIEQIVKDNNYKKQIIKRYNKDLHNFIPINWMTGENIERCKPTCCIKEWAKAYKNGEDYEYDKKHKSGVARGKIENDSCVVFDTLEEAQNCFDSFTKSKFTRFYMSIITTDIHIYQEYMPWMENYRKPWTDKRFYNHFNINNDQQKIIEEYADKVIKRLHKNDK